MAKRIQRLSALYCKQVQAPGLHADGAGLFLKIKPSGSKSWVYRYAANRKRHDIGLGPYPTISLGHARERAQRQRLLRIDGVDPLTAKRKSGQLGRTSKTFEWCAKAYIEGNKAAWKNARHHEQWENSLATYAYPRLGAMPVAAIETSHILEVLTPIWDKVPETASRVRGRIEVILNWAVIKEYRPEGANPARWKGHLGNVLPKKNKVARNGHHAAMPYNELPVFWARLSQEEGTPAAALRFLILCASRTDEVLGARWEEFDLTGKVWIIPAERMKPGREHRVALSPAAVAIIEQQLVNRVDPDLVFPRPSGGKMAERTLLDLLRRLVPKSKATNHGMRSCFCDWCNEETSFPADARELALSHSVGDKTEQAYRRRDLLVKRHRLAAAWAAFLAGAETEVITLPSIAGG